jgi:flagellar protein FlbD
MIEVTKLDNSRILLNIEQIQSIQETPDTVITFTSKERMLVKEPMSELTKRIMDYQHSIHRSTFMDPIFLERSPSSIQ